MSTHMTEDDWAVALEVFEACLPQRSAKGRNNHPFLQAVHYFCIHNITWRPLSKHLGKWNSVWKRLDRLSKTGVFETYFDSLASMSRSAHLVQMFDRSVVRAMSRQQVPKGAGRTGT